MPIDTERNVIRLSWEEWLSCRPEKRRALEKKGLSAPLRRSTAHPEARDALREFITEQNEVGALSQDTEDEPRRVR